jgi:predicted RNA-binding Zn-ribbon protein involved in translation (DUF1610 family)
MLGRLFKRKKKVVHACEECGSKNVTHKEELGRGLPPKNANKIHPPGRRVSWAGIWDVYTCEDCGHEDSKLRR